MLNAPETKDGLPVHEMAFEDVDIPAPEFGSLDEAVMSDLLGRESLTKAKLLSYGQALQMACQQKDQQIATLRQKLRELAPESEEAPAPAESSPLPVIPEPSHPVGYVSPYANGSEG